LSIKNPYLKNRFNFLQKEPFNLIWSKEERFISLKPLLMCSSSSSFVYIPSILAIIDPEYTPQIISGKQLLI